MDYLVWGKNKKDNTKMGGQVVDSKFNALKLKKKWEKDKRFKDWKFYIREYR